jgi:NADH dehydrogenase FAD-containing subunit
MKKVIIVGGGFAGLRSAKKLGRCQDVQLAMIDRRKAVARIGSLHFSGILACRSEEYHGPP